MDFRVAITHEQLREPRTLPAPPKLSTRFDEGPKSLESVCVCVRERERVCVRERERQRERESVCVCERESQRERVCV